MTFGEQLRKARKEQRLSQRDLAAQIGIDVSYLCLIEGGLRFPSPKLVPVLASFLGTTPSEVLRKVYEDKAQAQAERIEERPLLSQASIEAQAFRDRETFLNNVGRDEFHFPRDRDRIARVLCELDVREDDTLFGDNYKKIYAGLFPGDYQYQGQKGVIVVATENARKQRAKQTSAQTKLFHVMHEVGHYCLHWPTHKQQRGPVPNNKPLFCSSGDLSPMEQQANAYASAFLMPRSEVFNLLGSKRIVRMREQGRALCAHFFVTPWTLKHRLERLRISVID